MAQSRSIDLKPAFVFSGFPVIWLALYSVIVPAVADKISVTTAVIVKLAVTFLLLLNELFHLLLLCKMSVNFSITV